MASALRPMQHQAGMRHQHGRKSAPLTLHLCLFVAVQFLDFFLKGNLSLQPHPRRKPHDWLPKQGWQDLMKLTELAANKGSVGGCHTVCAGTSTVA